MDTYGMGPGYPEAGRPCGKWTAGWPPVRMRPDWRKDWGKAPAPTAPGMKVPDYMPPGQMLPGQMLPGQMLPGKIMPGKMMPGKMMPGKMMPDYMPPGQMLPPDEVMPRPTERPMETAPLRPAPEPEPAPMRPAAPDTALPTGAEREQLIRRLEAYMQDQVTAAAFYRALSEMTDHLKVKEYLEHAREDELKHLQMLRRLYRDLTGRSYEPSPEAVTVSSLTEGLLLAINEELAAFEEYRDEVLRFPRQQRLYRLFFELMTDEIEHATRFNTALYILGQAP